VRPAITMGTYWMYCFPLLLSPPILLDIIAVSHRHQHVHDGRTTTKKQTATTWPARRLHSPPTNPPRVVIYIPAEIIFRDGGKKKNAQGKALLCWPRRTFWARDDYDGRQLCQPIRDVIANLSAKGAVPGKRVTTMINKTGAVSHGERSGNDEKARTTGTWKSNGSRMIMTMMMMMMTMMMMMSTR
jgi:hypothetical protein